MIVKTIQNYITGYLRISIEGYYIERFINICRKENIPVWNIKKEKDIRLAFNIKIKDFKKICKIAKTTKCKLKIKKKKGFPFILNRYKKRKIFAIFLILVIILIGMSSNYVWNIEVIEENGNNLENIMQNLNQSGKRKIFAIFLILVIILIGMSSNYVWNIEVIEENGNNLENIMQNLNQSGLGVGKRKSEINTKEVINKVRLERNDVAWMGIELKGTNAIVKVVKSDEKPDIIDENEYCSIVADKAGIITKISAQDGTANVKVGDTINEGETLINGWVEGDENEYCSIVADKAGIITKISAQDGTANVKVGDTINEGETLINGWVEGKYTGIRYVHAKGEIQAKVWHTKHKFIEYNTTEKRETGNQEEKYAIKFNNFKINLGKGVSKFEIYDTSKRRNTSQSLVYKT